MNNLKDIEQMKEHIDKLWNCYNGMSLSFLRFGSLVNLAVGAASVSESFSPSTYIESAEKSLKEIEDAIKNYRQSQPQPFEVAPKSNEDVAAEFSETMFGLGIK